MTGAATVLPTVGDRIRWLRKRAGMTQQDLSDALSEAGIDSVARPTLSGWEKLGKKPPLAAINEMARLFNTTADFMLLVTNDPNPPRPTELTLIVSARDLTERGILNEWIAIMRALPADKQARLLSVAKAIASQYAPASSSEVREADAIFSAIYAVGGPDAVEVAMKILDGSLPNLAGALGARLHAGESEEKQEPAERFKSD